MQKIRILLVDDHTVMRQGLRALLSAVADFQVVGEAENGRQAVQMAKDLQPDVAVVDVAMPVLNGLEATRRIRRAVPNTKVLILSSYSNEGYARQSTECGASGYLIKQTAADDLIHAIHEVHQGRAYFSPAVARRLRDRTRETTPTGRRHKKGPGRLTSRELEVLQLIAEGRLNKQIAADLSISIKTVEKHRQQVMDKLGIHDIAGLTRHAIANGIVEGAAETLD